jgi:hypothetical protein
MAKTHIPGRAHKKRADGSRVRGKKIVSHGTYRCKRKPTSPRCRNQA